MAIFDAEEYSQFRVAYPEALLSSLSAFCVPFCVKSNSLNVVDLGGGTGLSAKSFLKLFPWAELTVVEPDANMLEVARDTLKDFPKTKFALNRAEDFRFESQVDLVLAGSAWHWMNQDLILKHLELIHASAVFIFEYQFPKAKAASGLNDWIRREFNLKWRTTQQVPRGTLIELTQGLRDSNFFQEVGRDSLLVEREFSAEAFYGMIVSQSRYLAYEKTLSDSEKIRGRQQLSLELESYFGSTGVIPFELFYESVLFRHRNV
jgi:hypothetical protein